jgi:GABA permease
MAFFLVRSSLAAGSEPPARRPAPRADGAHGVLVVVDEGCPGEALCARLAGTLPDAETELLVVAPTLVSAVRYLDSDIDRAREAAGARLDETLAALAEAGIPARGHVGSESPLEAIADALAVFPADEIVVATPPPERTNWLERGVVDRARDLYEIPVSHLVVDSPRVDDGHRP